MVTIVIYQFGYVKCILEATSKGRLYHLISDQPVTRLALLIRQLQRRNPDFGRQVIVRARMNAYDPF